MSEDEALDLVARKLLALIWAHVTGRNEVMPDQADFPGLTEDQWTMVVGRAAIKIGTITNVSEGRFFAAYEHLTGETP